MTGSWLELDPEWLCFPKDFQAKKHHFICYKHFPAPFLCPKASCWLSCAAFRDEKAISSSTGLWNQLPFKSVFGKRKEEPYGKFMGQQTPQLEWPLTDWDRNTDELGWHAGPDSQILPVCSHVPTWSCVALAKCHILVLTVAGWLFHQQPKTSHYDSATVPWLLFN